MAEPFLWKIPGFRIPELDDISEPNMLKAIHYPLGRNLIVHGAPWTGKTVVWIHRFLEAKRCGLRVLFLCYNKLLQYYVSEHLQGDKCVKTFDSWFAHLPNRDGGKNKQDDTDSEEGYVMERKEDEIVKIFQEFIAKNPKYDLLVIDEAQDMSESFASALSLIANHVTILMDANQQLRVASQGSGIPIDETIKQAFSDIQEMTLNRNYRNTKEIYRFAAERFMPNSEIANNPNLYESSPSDPDSVPDMFMQLQFETQMLPRVLEYINARPTSERIGILLPNSRLVKSAEKFFDGHNVYPDVYISKRIPSKDLFLSERVMVTNYACSKGLEFDTALILVLRNEVSRQQIDPQLYVLSTRGRKKLAFFFD